MAQPIILAPPPLPSEFERMCCNNESYDPCRSPATLFCNTCKLVGYCSKRCELNHSRTHKTDCLNPLGAQDWNPDYRKEGRTKKVDTPWMKTDRVYRPDREHRKIWWGNTPAFDLLNLAENEGEDYQGDLSLYFAASEDLRNVITTLAHLPEGYNGHISCVVNDIDEDISMKNGVLMRLLFCQDDEVKAAEDALHLWYSAKITGKSRRRIQSALESCSEKARIMGMTEYKKIIESDSHRSKLAVTIGYNAYNGKSMSLGKESTVEGDYCSFWAGYWKTPEIQDSDQTAAEERRKAAVLDHTDELHINYELRFNPKQRIADMKFRETGVLQPFGAPVLDNLVINTTLFDRHYRWMPNTMQSPMSGWSLKSVLASGARHHIPQNDIYGALHFHVRDLLIKFHRSIRKHSINIFITNAKPSDRPTPFAVAMDDDVEGHKLLFDRIDTSNLAYEFWIGTYDCLSLGAFLKPENHHATLVTLYENAVQDTETTLQSAANDALRLRPELRKILMPECINVAEAGDPEFIEKQAQFWFGDHEAIFAINKQKWYFEGYAEQLKMEEKEEHSIVGKFPFRMSITDTAEEMALKRFHDCESARYVEWRRVHAPVEMPDSDTENLDREVRVPVEPLNLDTANLDPDARPQKRLRSS